MVTPFTEVGMITKVTAIQSVTETPRQSHDMTEALPCHLQDLMEPPGHRIVRIFRYIFLVPGAPLTGHTDAVEHNINTCDRPPIRVDYHQLNDATTKDAYSLPRIDDTLDMLAGK